MRKLSRGGLLEPHSELTFEPGLNSNLDFPEADEVFLIPTPLCKGVPDTWVLCECHTGSGT